MKETIRSLLLNFIVLKIKLITKNGLELNNDKPGAVAYLRVKKAIAYNDKLTLYPQFFGRIVWGSNIPEVFKTYTGGQDLTNYFDIQVPFIGLRRMEIASTNSFVFRTDFQYELFRNNYLIRDRCKN